SNGLMPILTPCVTTPLPSGLTLMRTLKSTTRLRPTRIVLKLVSSFRWSGWRASAQQCALVVFDDPARVADDLRHQPCDAGDVVEQSLPPPGPEQAGVEVPGLQQFAPPRTTHEVGDVFELRVCPVEQLHHFIGHAVLADARGVVQIAEDLVGGTFIVADQELFDVVVDRCFPGGTEARAH